MAITRSKEKVRDGYFGDLPPEIQKKVMDAHKIIVNVVKDILDEDHYSDLKDSRWAMSCIDDFCVMPKDKDQVGSFRVYKSGKKYKCMIQLTGHFRNHQYGWIEELLHEFIRHVHMTAKIQVRKKLDMTLNNEGSVSNPYEGFDIYPNPKVVQDIWDKMEGRKTMTLIEGYEIDDNFLISEGYFDNTVELDEFLLEASHGKLRFDFRKAYDWNTGHGLKLVYGLDGIKVHDIGTGYTRNHPEENREEIIADIQKNIKKKGNLDHLSSGQKILAIIDRVTGDRLQEADVIGPFAPAVPNSALDIWDGDLKSLHSYYQSKGEDFRNKYIQHIKVGDVEKHPSFKATHWFKGDVVEKEWFPGFKVKEDNSIKRGQAGEGLKYGRGAKLNDMEGTVSPGSPIKYKNPSKKDIRRNPELYRDQLSDEEFERLMKNKSPDEVKQDIEDVKSDIEHLSEDEDIPPEEKEGILARLRKNLKRLVEWLKKMMKSLGRSLGIIESVILEGGDYYDAKKLPEHLLRLVYETNSLIYDTFKDLSKDPKYSALTSREKDFKKCLESLDGSGNKTEIGFTTITDPDEDIKVTIVVTPEPRQMLTSWSSGGDSAGEAQNALRQLKEDTLKKIQDKWNNDNPTKYLELDGKEDKEFFVIHCYADYAMKLKNHLDNPKSVPYTEATSGQEYNVDMTEAQAKKTLGTLSQGIMNDHKKVSQYTANIFSNIITKNLLSKWAPGYQKFHIVLDDSLRSTYFNFKVPKMTQDFIERFINGREKLGGLLHREPTITVRMSPRLFSSMENPDDAFNFFKSAIKYYGTSLETYGSKLMAEVMKLNTPTKHLIATTKLSGIVTIPMSLLFTFSDVKMSDKDTFKITKEDIQTVQQFVKNITSRYAAPEKEKNAIINDLKEVIRSLQESTDIEMNENLISMKHLPEAVQQYYDGKFNSVMESVNEKLHAEQVDRLAMRNNPNPQVRYLSEKFGVKKLKKIPTDLVAYITIEAEAIKDANDKMMIASYCLGKIEIVEWYIELLEVGSNKYVVPHTKPYLESVRTQLLACYKKIMATPIPKTQERPLIDIQYPKGYEG